MPSVEQTQPLISHLLELRSRLLRALIAVLIVFLGLIYFANDIYEFVSAPLVERLPQGATMIANDVASIFYAIKVNSDCLCFCCSAFHFISGMACCLVV